MKKLLLMFKSLLIVVLSLTFLVVNAQQKMHYNGMSKEEYKQLKLDVMNGIIEEPGMEKYNPSENGSRQGGDDFGSATPIDEVPYSDIGSTTGQSIDVTAYCGTSSGTAPDLVYSFTPATSGTINVTTCSEISFYDTKLLVFENSESTCVTGNDDITDGSCPYNLLGSDWSLLSEVEFQANAGNTYYIVVTGFGSSSGQYELLVTGDATPTPPGQVPLSDYAIYIGIFLILAFTAIRFRRAFV
ncbi:MAG: hypothetical protein U5Q03_00430 [Bacteroidota bacterium]|nr:hypothetical protein [Bacteroidota bacterium]